MPFCPPILSRNPNSVLPKPCSLGGKPIVEVGLDETGVLDGVSFGVDGGLSKPTRDFLEDERGVILLLRNALTGVTFSCAPILTRGVAALLLRMVRLLCELFADAAEGATASRGVRGVFAVRLLASFGFSVFGVFRSMGILYT